MGGDEFAFSSRWCLDRAMITGRYSQGLVSEFDAHVEGRTANVFQIFEELGALEGTPSARPSRTKPAAPYSGPWLDGLWHKHYTQARFMAQNIALHWNPSRLRKFVNDTLSGRQFFDQEAINVLTHGLVDGGYIERGKARKLTGEWIVFARQDEVSYYLTMARHDEEDEAIWRRCVACRTDFPDLLILQEDRS